MEVFASKHCGDNDITIHLAMWCVTGCFRVSRSSRIPIPAERSTRGLYGEVDCPTGISRRRKIDVKMNVVCSGVKIPYSANGTCLFGSASLAIRENRSRYDTSTVLDRLTNDHR